ncbi:hypothetical protein [Actinoallomurus acanthiterrae]
MTAGFADGDDVSVRPSDAGEPAADRPDRLIPSVRVDAGVVGGHQAVGDRQGRGA